ncbi:MAG TPA: SIMPL domain-containing protein [Propioniciclava tarda]|nr:SIMPL domain-containing protein [Propioniciclava tarda]HQA30640.1 SIMPL domain-containing protein [Propioniciclava tarda]HQD61181.1 SIMPL domain-containing protein [Propioniciclava tarda]
MQISVSGEQHVRVAPERAELYLTVSQENTDRAKVIADVTAAANQIGDELDGFKTAGVVERFSVQPLRTYSWKRGKTSVERVTASVEVNVRFTDFEALGRYTSDLAGRTGVRLGYVSWQLTDATAERLSDECIEGAVKRARQRAEAMAKAAGVGAIEITEVADPGLLGTPEARMDFGGDTRVYAMAASMKGGAEPESVKVVPEEIEIGAQLQLRFRSVES